MSLAVIAMKCASAGLSTGQGAAAVQVLWLVAGLLPACRAGCGAGQAEQQ